MQEQLQLMYIQAMLVDSQLCLGSDKQYDLLKRVFTMMLITQLVKRDYLFNCMSHYVLQYVLQYVTLSDSIKIINIYIYGW